MQKASDEVVVATVFGDLQQAKDSTLMPVSRAHRWVTRRAGEGGHSPYHARLTAVVEIGLTGARLTTISQFPRSVGMALLGAWNLYWAVRILKDWAKRSQR